MGRQPHGTAWFLDSVSKMLQTAPRVFWLILRYSTEVGKIFFAATSQGAEEAPGQWGCPGAGQPGREGSVKPVGSPAFPLHCAAQQ